MRFVINHPTQPGAVIYYGVDHALAGGFFAEIHQGRTVRSFDGLHPASGFDPFRDPMNKVLRWIGTVGGMYTEEDLETVLLLQERGESIPGRLQVVAEVIANLKVAADSG